VQYIKNKSINKGITMKNKRKNEAKTDIDLFNYIKDKRVYSKNWTVQKQDNKYIQEILDKTSKKGTGNQGYQSIFLKLRISQFILPWME